MNIRGLAISCGVISCILYVIMSGFLISVLVKIVENLDPFQSNIELYLVFTSLELVFSLAMALMCIVLIVGIKKRHSDLMTPWIFMAIIGVVTNVVDLIIDHSRLSIEGIVFKVVFVDFLLQSIPIVVLNACIWYPICKLWKELNDLRHYRQRLISDSPLPTYLNTSLQTAMGVNEATAGTSREAENPRGYFATYMTMS
ncbi:uncharacterized protein LOC106092231 isoform X2 [Stomoxys calcitrans]|uniref:Uncharacterized protein n=1 Tax=Stomoxys calcitrans TaxID=35570 RepID=A0A1I8P3N6_STOCA|nr:uncharacterized protein LOC106092231 isoform X2 [Stomoxys calcitrans]